MLFQLHYPGRRGWLDDMLTNVSVSRRELPEASPAPLIKTASTAASVTGTGPVALHGAETVSPGLSASFLSLFL